MHGENPHQTFTPRAVAKAFEDLQEYLRQVEQVMLALYDDPDEQVIQQALETLAAVRDGIGLSEMFKDLFAQVRDTLVAALAVEAPDLTMQTIAQHAGYGDSYAARVARRKLGTTRRQARAASRDAPADAAHPGSPAAAS